MLGFNELGRLSIWDNSNYGVVYTMPPKLPQLGMIILLFVWFLCLCIKASFLQKCMRSWDELGVFQPKSHFTFALGLSSMVSIFKWSWSKIKTSSINIFIQLMSVYFDGWEAMCHFLSTMRETSSNGSNGSWH
jgi:hypothetical protein